MKNLFSRPNGMYFICRNILLFSTVLLFSCTQKVYQYKTECEIDGSPGNKPTDPGNYFYIMKMSTQDFKTLSKPGRSFKRFIFQYKNVKSEKGRNEYEMASFAWNKGLGRGKFSKKMFLIRDYKLEVLWVDPKDTFSFVNLEIWDENINKDVFNNTDSICLIPYYDKCKKVMSLKAVSANKLQNDNSYRKNKIKTNPHQNPNYAIRTGFKAANIDLLDRQFLDELLMRFLDLPSELLINPCPPDFPQGN